MTSWHDYPGAILGRTEAALLRWFHHNVQPGETWLDVGAHYGYTAIALSRLAGQDGRIFAFEPVITTAGNLCVTRDLNKLSQLTVVPIGLDDSPGMKAIRVPRVRGMATFLPDGGAVDDTIYVVALTTIWDALAGDNPNIHGVKIDVQGMEINALLGMRALLIRFRPKLVIEIHHGVDRPALLSALADFGYTLSGIPIEPFTGVPTNSYADNKSYAFHAVPS
jgi:FkbM family methyltransferase